jgi:hypothetical protein
MRKTTMMFLLVALATISGAMLVDFSPASLRQNVVATKQTVSGLSEAVNRPAAVSAFPAHQLAANFGNLPLSFEANQGQVRRPVQFLARGVGYTIFLTDDEAVLTLRKSRPAMSRPGKFGPPGQLDPLGPARPRAARSPSLADGFESLLPSLIPDFGQLVPQLNAGKTGVAIGLESPPPQVMRMRLMGGNAQARVVGLDELPGRSNYFIGNDPKKWRTNVPSYAQVRYEDVYPGVDLVYYGTQGGRLEYDFVVAPGADPNQIRLSFAGADGMRLDAASGDLVMNVGGDEVRLEKPVAYQPAVAAVSSPPSNPVAAVYDRRRRSESAATAELDGKFVLASNNQVAFRVVGYDPKRALVIDPVLTYSTYLGGTQTNATSCWPPGNGCSPTPTTRTDAGLGIAVDSSGNAYVTGYTDSTDFPTVNSLQAYNLGNDHDDAYDAFVTKFNAAGSALVYSTYLGGSGADYAQGIAVDSSGNAYVTGTTLSSDFPTVNPLQATCDSPPTFGGGCNNASDAFVAKLNASGSALVYSTYLGGTGYDWGQGIAVDYFGSAYVTGYTQSSDFPTTTSFQPTSDCSDCFNAFVSKLNPAGNGFAYSTYLGGSTNGDNVEAFGIAVDSSGEAYVTGWTTAADFPTVNPIQATNYAQNVFVSKLNAAGSALVYSTYLGGHSSDYGEAIAVDSSGSAYVTGTTDSADFPTVNPIQATCTGCTFYGDAFVTKFNAAGSALVYSTYLGGRSYDLGWGIAVDSSGDAYVTGQTYSTDFPTANPIQSNCASCAASGTSDAFVAMLNAAGSALIYSTYLGGSGQDVGLAIAATPSGDAYVTGQTASTDFPTANALQTTCSSCTEGGSDTGAVMGTGFGDAFVAMLTTMPGASLSPSPLTFPAEFVETSSAQTVTLSNTGEASLAISGITTGGDFSQTNTCGSTLDAGANCAISVTFKPIAAGARTGTLWIFDNATGSPQSVALSGTGLVYTVGPHPPIVLRPPSEPVPGQPVPVSPPTPPITEPISAPGPVSVPAPAPASAAAVSLAPASLTFSAQVVGARSSAQTVTLANTGNETLTLAGISTSANFSQTNNCGASIPGGGFCTISITFSPTAAGSLAGILTISDNSHGVAGSKQTVTLSGTGIDPVVR